MSRIVVTIHGIGRTESRFWQPQVEAIQAHLGTAPRHHAVWWGDLTDAGAPIRRAGDRAVRQLHVLAEHFTGRPAKYTPRLVLAAADLLHRLTDSSAGVVAYLLPTGKREAIRQRLRETLAERTRQNDEIVLVSESLGCLVAFDVLRKEAHKYNIVAWITLGCPLRTMIGAGQRRADLGAINRHTVGQWFNLYSPRDLVAAPVAQMFPGYPVRDQRVEGPRGRLQSHRYWNSPSVPALIARLLRA